MHRRHEGRFIPVEAAIISSDTSTTTLACQISGHQDNAASLLKIYVLANEHVSNTRHVLLLPDQAVLEEVRSDPNVLFLSQHNLLQRTEFICGFCSSCRGACSLP